MQPCPSQDTISPAADILVGLRLFYNDAWECITSHDLAWYAGFKLGV